MKCQRNYQVPRIGPQKLILKIDSIRDPRGFPREMLSTMPVSTGFVDSSGDSSGSPSDKPTKYPSPVPIIKPVSEPSENPTKYHSNVPKEFQCTKLSNTLMEHSSLNPTGAPRTMSTEIQVQTTYPIQAHTQMYSRKTPKRHK